MRYICPIGCGCILENDIHKFSDGFEYRSPKELDHKPHNCAISEILYNVSWKGMDFEGEADYQDMEHGLYSAYEKRLAISYKTFQELMHKSILDSGLKILGTNFINIMLPMLRYGRLFELIQFNQTNIINHTLPFLKYRSTSNFCWEIESISRYRIKDSTNNTELCEMIPVILPTDNGYQLEYLGFCYELMTKFEDAKKCYELQYEFTKEQELLDKSAELYKKIMRRNEFQNALHDLKLEDTEKELKHTETNLKKYIAKLFSNDFRELYRRDPKLEKMVRTNRNKNKTSILKIKENDDTDYMSLGNLNVILKIYGTKIRAKEDEACKKCNRKWKKNDDIFLEIKPKRILCADEICFKEQNGLFKDVNQEFRSNVEIITKFRNTNSHPNEYENNDMFIYSFKQAYFTCKVINNEIDNYLEKNPYV